MHGDTHCFNVIRITLQNQCVTSDLWYRMRWMMRITHRFLRHCICHIWVECVEAGRFSRPHIGQEAGSNFDSVLLIGGAEMATACLLKRGIIFNIRRVLYPKAKVTN